MDVAISLTSVNNIKNALLVLSALGLTAYKWNPGTYIPNNGTVTTDYIVVGAGTAGSIVGYRLSEDPGVNVMMIEAGGDPPPGSEVMERKKMLGIGTMLTITD